MYNLCQPVARVIILHNNTTLSIIRMSYTDVEICKPTRITSRIAYHSYLHFGYISVFVLIIKRIYNGI